MNEKTVRDLSKGLEASLYVCEYDRVRGEPVNSELILGLAQNVINAVNQMHEPSKRALKRRDYAEAVITMYQPLQPSAPAAEPQLSEPLGMPSFWHS